MSDRIAWGVVHCGGKSPYIFSETRRTRREAREWFYSWWRDDQQAATALKSKTYRIVKVRIAVVE